MDMGNANIAGVNIRPAHAPRLRVPTFGTYIHIGKAKVLSVFAHKLGRCILYIKNIQARSFDETSHWRALIQFVKVAYTLAEPGAN